MSCAALRRLSAVSLFRPRSLKSQARPTCLLGRQSADDRCADWRQLKDDAVTVLRAGVQCVLAGMGRRGLLLVTHRSWAATLPADVTVAHGSCYRYTQTESGLCLSFVRLTPCGLGADLHGLSRWRAVLAFPGAAAPSAPECEWRRSDVAVVMCNRLCSNMDMRCRRLALCGIQLGMAAAMAPGPMRHERSPRISTVSREWSHGGRGNQRGSTTRHDTG
jgi:hypothetical protein